MSQPTYALAGNPAQAIIVSDASTVGYPMPDMRTVFGEVYLPRVYGKDLSTFEIASSGTISVTLQDAHALTLDGNAEEVHIRGAGSNTAVQLDSGATALRMEGASNLIALSAPSNVSIRAGDASSMATHTRCTLSGSDVDFWAPHDFVINAGNDIVLKGTKLVIDVEEMDIKYGFQVSPNTGSLELVQTTPNSSQVVATFGRPKIM